MLLFRVKALVKVTLLALAACLRHGHRPHVEVTSAGWARLIEILEWPRIKAQDASAGDLLEIVRHNGKQRYELGEQDGARYIRAVQGHLRREVKVSFT